MVSVLSARLLFVEGQSIQFQRCLIRMVWVNKIEIICLHPLTLIGHEPPVKFLRFECLERLNCKYGLKILNSPKTLIITALVFEVLNGVVHQASITCYQCERPLICSLNKVTPQQYKNNFSQR